MKQISNLELKQYLDEIISCNAFELHKSEETQDGYDVYIPYMMNDALECYLILKHASLTGTYRAEMKEEMSVELVDAERGTAAIFHQGPELVFTVWFENCYFEQQFYRYDQIGHFWVEGEEHWRRLVYMIGTICDKYSYMGCQACNDLELELIPLMGFAPFRHFSPIHDSLDAYYEEDSEGTYCMQSLAKEAGDHWFASLVTMYRILPMKRYTKQVLARAMQSPRRACLYERIFRLVEEASKQYPERIYPEHIAKDIQNQREMVIHNMKEYGYSGEYPLFHKGDIQVLAMEEHPFTILEWEHYSFKVQFMISEIQNGKQMLQSKGNHGYAKNAGFFRKKGNRGWIARSLDQVPGSL